MPNLCRTLAATLPAAALLAGAALAGTALAGDPAPNLSGSFPEGLTDPAGRICVVNASPARALFAVEPQGGTRRLAWLAPGERLCAEAAEAGRPGVVSVYHAEETFEGCSRLVAAGRIEPMLRYAEFDRCAWGANS